MAMSAMQPSSIQPSQTVMPSTSSKDSGGSTMKPPSYAVLSSPDGFFKLQWTYNNSKELIFKMTCKTTGWCAVGFTTTADGKAMKNYDIAVAGYASAAGYIDVSKKTVISWMTKYFFILARNFSTNL